MHYDTGAWDSQLFGMGADAVLRRFGQADVRPYADNILNALFRIIEQGDSPQAIAANDHLMKCLSLFPSLAIVIVVVLDGRDRTMS